MVSSLLRMQLLEDDGESAYVDEKEAEKQHADARPAWMRVLHNSGRTWSQLLPSQLQTLRRTVDNIRDPLYRYFEREVNIGAKLLTTVQNDIRDIIAICEVREAARWLEGAAGGRGLRARENGTGS